jgi:hypothetical protein
MSCDSRTGTQATGCPLLAVPVLCCGGHAVLLAAGVGSLTAVTGDHAGTTLLVLAALEWSRPLLPLWCGAAGGKGGPRARRRTAVQRHQRRWHLLGAARW